ncbi:NAD(P)H-binding protein [Paucilactobacillus suebicus]|uniref:Saccharopine dehydrogenase related protein n=1 Tax=Paucilactobacillus suebicus DSM 5007 = KCTC 3549 TaxID=1423807 RepID=A0A0R1W057_9LACO|nr:NAD(P)H-binding protein [Paucilactobacillus suebicus]KRM10997.1 saccharopine dehydrogenase related protein [Paucilactobacillus suebicus DSM 5007 = KCTC 3549]
MNLLILGANGQIAKIIENRILSEDEFSNVNLTLFLRDKARLNELSNNPRVSLIEGNISDQAALQQALNNQQLVLLATVDTDSNNTITKTVISAMKKQNVNRILAASSIGIYGEEPNPAFHSWNQQTLSSALKPMRQADELLKSSSLIYTTLRFGWLNDRDQVQYSITEQGTKFAGGSGSRKSMADAILTIIANPSLYENETIGISDPSTKDAPSVVY